MTASTSGLSRAPLQTGARAERHVLLDPLALLRRVGLAIPALEARDDAVEGERVLTPPAHPVPILDVHLLALGSVEEEILVLHRHVLPRDRGVDLVAVGDGLDHGLVEAGRPAERPRHERTVVDGERRIRHDEIGVDLLLRTEAGAARARAVRRVEREDARLQLRQRHTVIGTREVLREEHRLAVDYVDRDEPFGERRSRLDRLREPRPQVRFHHEPVHDDLDRVLELLVEVGDALLEHDFLAVDLHAREAFAHDLVEQILVLTFAVAHDRRIDREARTLREPQHLIDDRVDRLPRDGLATDRAMRPSDPRVEQPEVVVDFRDRPDRRARVA